MPHRRALLLWVAASLTMPGVLCAQVRASIPRVAVVLNGTPDTHRAYLTAFLSGMSAFGYAESRNVIFDVYWAEGQLNRLPMIMAELLRHAPDVLVTAGSQAVRAAKSATSTVPIVMATVADPVEQGFVDSLSEPGGNITGIGVKSAALMSKGLELMVEAVPRASPFGVLVNPSNSFHSSAWRQTENIARSIGVRLLRFDASDIGDLERALARMVRQRPQSLVVGADALFNSFRRRIAVFAEKNLLPVVQSFREFVDDGGFMSYSPDIANNHRLAASYVVRILKGDKPNTMAIDQPDTYELTINARTLRILGIRLPPAFVARVDRFVD